MSCLPCQIRAIQICRAECLSEKSESDGPVKPLAREYVQINVVLIFGEVTCYIGSLNQLHQRIATFLLFTEHYNTGLSEGHHVNVFDEAFGEGCDYGLRTQCNGITATGIDNQMIAPVLLVFLILSGLSYHNST